MKRRILKLSMLLKAVKFHANYEKNKINSRNSNFQKSKISLLETSKIREIRTKKVILRGNRNISRGKIKNYTITKGYKKQNRKFQDSKVPVSQIINP